MKAVSFRLSYKYVSIVCLILCLPRRLGLQFEGCSQCRNASYVLGGMGIGYKAKEGRKGYGDLPRRGGYCRPWYYACE